MINESTWQELAANAQGTQTGTVRTRVASASPHDIYIVLRFPLEERCLWYDFDDSVLADGAKPPSFEAIDVELTAHPELPNRIRCELALKQIELANVFVALIDDVVSAVSATTDDEAGVKVLFSRLERWHELLRSVRPQGLGALERRGLIGELMVFRSLIKSNVDAAVVAASWTGPYGAHQDFQAERAAIEVKATVLKQPQNLVIASERELDDTGINALFLVHISLDERRGGERHVSKRSGRRRSTSA